MLEVIRRNAQSWGVKLLFGIIVLVFVFWGVGSFTDSNSNVVAYVNETPITLDEYRQHYEQRLEQVRRQMPEADEETLRQMGFRRQVLNELVDEKLLRLKASEYGLRVPDAEVQQAIAEIPAFRNQNGQFDREIYKKLILSQGMTPAQFEAGYRSSILMQTMTDYLVTPAVVTDEEAREIFRYAREEARADYVLFPPEEYMESVEVEEKDVQAAYEEQRERFTVPAQAEIAYLEFTPEALADPADVTEEEARRAYENNPDAYTRQARVKARHILLRAPDDASGEKAGQAEARLEEIAARIDSAEEFAAAAKEYSEGPSAPSGGDLGWFPRGSMVESFEKAAFDAEPGSLVGPVRTQFGYHLIWVEDRQEAGVLPFEEAELDVRQNVARDKAAGKVTDLLDEAIARVAAGESLEQVAETLEIGLRHAGPFPQNQGPSRPSLSQEAVQRLSTLTPGDTLDEPLSIEGGYALVQLTSQTPSKVRPLEEVRETIVTELKRKEAMVLAEEEAASVAAALHDPQKRERAMERIQDRIKTTEAFTRQGFIPGLGMNERFAAAVFVAEEGDWLDEPYLSERGAFIARLSERTPPTDAEWAEAKQSFIQQLEQSKRQQLYQGFMSELRGEATIEIANKRVLGE